MIPGRSTYVRLSLFYFLYYAFLGVMMPYWSLYLQAVGLDATAIGVVLAVMAATRIVTPNLWGWIADRSGCHLRLIRVGALFAAASFAALPWHSGVAWIVAVVLVHSVFWNAILAQFEVITLASLGDAVQRYGLVRLWGSVSFIVAVVGSGMLFDHVDVIRVPWLLLALLVLIAAGAWLIRDPDAGSRTRDVQGIGDRLREPALVAFLAASFLLQFSHAPYYGFFSLYLEQYGYTRAATGQMWALGVVAEIGVFAFAHRLLARHGLRSILLASLLLAALRWLMIGFGARYILVLLLAQCLHAASFGSFHAAGIELLRRHFAPAQQGRGQALYAAVSFGAGGATGALTSGVLWDVEPQLAYVVAALAAFAGWGLVLLAVRGPLAGTVHAAERVQAEGRIA